MKEVKLIYDNKKDYFIVKGVIFWAEWYNPYLNLSRTTEGKLIRIPAELHDEYRSYQIAYKAIRDAKEKAKTTELLRLHLKSK